MIVSQNVIKIMRIKYNFNCYKPEHVILKIRTYIVLLI